MGTLIRALLRSLARDQTVQRSECDMNDQTNPIGLHHLGALGLLRSAQVDGGTKVLGLLPYVGLDANITGGRLVASALDTLNKSSALSAIDSHDSKSVMPAVRTQSGAIKPMVSVVAESNPTANLLHSQMLNAQRGQEGRATSSAPVQNDFDVPLPQTMQVSQGEKPDFWQRRKKVWNDYLQDVPFSASDHQVEAGHWYTPLHQGLQTGVDTAVNTAKGLGNLGVMTLNSPALALGMWEGDFGDGVDDYQNILNSTMGVPGLNVAGGVVRAITNSGLASAAKIAGRVRGTKLPPAPVLPNAARVVNDPQHAIPIGSTPSPVGEVGKIADKTGGAKQALAARFAETHPVRILPRSILLVSPLRQCRKG